MYVCMCEGETRSGWCVRQGVKTIVYIFPRLANSPRSPQRPGEAAESTVILVWMGYSSRATIVGSVALTVSDLAVRERTPKRLLCLDSVSDRNIGYEFFP